LVSAGTRKSNITVLHCNTGYPADYKDANLKAILTIKDKLGVRVGFSDHSLGIELSLAAIALGVSVIEKHFTLDKNMPGPDHKASLEPPEFSLMVAAIRHIESALGDGIKKPRGKELSNIDIVRKSIIAARNIKKGEVLSEANLTVKRPGNGINPMEWDKILGQRAKKSFQEDELIKI
jgi:N,N'-diacetyllegionaminate synthase